MFGSRRTRATHTTHTTHASTRGRGFGGMFHRTNPNRRAGGYKVSTCATLTLLALTFTPGCTAQPQYHNGWSSTCQAWFEVYGKSMS